MQAAHTLDIGMEDRGPDRVCPVAPAVNEAGASLSRELVETALVVVQSLLSISAAVGLGPLLVYLFG